MGARLATLTGATPQRELVGIGTMDPRAPSASPSESGYKCCAYFSNWSTHNKKIQPNDLPVEDLTHVFYAYFQPDSNGKVLSIDKFADYQKENSDDDRNEYEGNKVQGCIEQFSLLKQRHRHLKVVLSIGGWGEKVTANMASSAATEESRTRFADTAVEILKDCGFDGIDIDWKWPSNATQAHDYLMLVATVRAALDQYTSSIHGERAMSLSAACPASTDLYQLIEMTNMDRHLDFWNLIAYDFAGTGSSHTTAHQSNLLTGSDRQKTPYNTAQAISDIEDFGIVPEKVVLGCPLFGRGFADTDGLGKPFSSLAPGELENGIRDFKTLPLPGAEVHFDSTANASYTYDSGNRELWSYDNPESVMMKASFIKVQQLGGAMFWEASGDRKGEESLISLMAKSLDGDDGKGLDRSDNTIAYPDSKFVNIKDARHTLTARRRLYSRSKSMGL